MRRSSESSPYHDDAPRRRVRRTPSHDSERHHNNDITVARNLDIVENVPTSPYSQSTFSFMGSPRGNMSSPTRSVQPVSPHRNVNFPHPGLQRSLSQPVGSMGELSPRSPFPHSVVSPSRYQSSSPMYVSPAPSPSAPPSTPSCSTPSSVTYTLSRGPVSPRGSGLKTPEFYPGLSDAPQLSPADSNYPVSFMSEPKPVYSEFPREQQFSFGSGGPSPGGTIHHLGYNTPHRTPPLPSPTIFPNQPSPKSLTSRQQSAPNSQSSVSVSSPVSGGRTQVSNGRGVMYESPDTVRLRHLVIAYYNGEMESLKVNFREKLQEWFFLQTGGNMMDFLLWKKRPSSQFLAFLNANRLDDNAGVNSPLTAVAVSPWPQQQPEVSNSSAVNYAALQRHAFEQVGLDPRKNIPGSFNVNPSYKTKISVTEGVAPNVSPFTGNQPNPRTTVATSAPPFSRSLSVPNPPLESRMLTGVVGQFNDFSSPVPKTPVGQVSTGNTLQTKVHSQTLSNGLTPLAKGLRTTSSTRVQSLSSVLENSFSSQEDIAVEAKKEAEVLKRVAELRKEGIWTLSRLPKVQEMPRCKAHWDYLLEEMHWLATDFAQERRWKRGVAKKVSLR